MAAQDTHQLWTFVVLSLLVGGVLGFVIGGAFSGGSGAEGQAVATAPKYTCTDYDGINIYTQSSASSSYYGQQYYDVCANSSMVNEAVCNGYFAQYRLFTCPSGICASGKCINTNQINYTCSDSDGGQNYGVYGTATSTYNNAKSDQCISSSVLFESICKGYQSAYVTYNCGEGQQCLGGKCDTTTPVLPDLIPSIALISANPHSFVFFFYIRNMAQVSAPTSTVWVTVHNKNNSYFNEIGYPVPALLPGEPYQKYVTYTDITMVVDDIISVSVEADRGNQITEFNETNNVATTTMRVT